MPFLRPNRSEKDLRRRSTLDPYNLFRRGDQDSRANASSDNLSSDRGAVSYDGARPDISSSDIERSPSTADRPTTPVQEHTPNTRRFSLARFRHASDSQLSVKAKQQAEKEKPPVPAMPTAPAIITTAPTMEPVMEDTHWSPNRRRFLTLGKKPRGRVLEQMAAEERSSQSARNSFENQRKTIEKKKRNKPFGSLRGSRNAEEPADLSDRNSGENARTPQNSNSPSPSSSTFFKLSRRNKNRKSLFPLPVKIPPPEFPDTAPTTPRASTSAKSSGSANQSPDAYSPPLTAIHRSGVANNSSEGKDLPLQYNTQNAVAQASITFAAPAASSLLRNDSNASGRTSSSSPIAQRPLQRRTRSSTMGSACGREEVAPPTPPYGRTSTSTAGRNSFSNLFSLGHRFRQNSEPHSPRHGSPSQNHNGTPGHLSHSSSMNISREQLLPEREEGEAPGKYLERLEEHIVRSMVASILAKHNDPFFLSVLRSYMRKFAFFGDPIDFAMRKLLMEVELPKETQQIDRVLEGFADRYCECNPGIYISVDHAYFITFSLVLLQSDTFNKSVKRKMQKPDYIRNSHREGDGISEDVLGCIYDNIVYTPFIKFEDDVDIRGVKTKAKKPKGPKTLNKVASVDPVKKSYREPIDPYTLILEGNLDVLRPPIKEILNLDDPFNYLGSGSSLDIRNYYGIFSKYGVLQIISARSRPEAFMSPSSMENPMDATPGIVEMPVIKVGILWRKDTKRKTARSPWQEWGAILTRSGFSLFKNSGWVKGLLHQLDLHHKRGNTGTPCVFAPPVPDYKADYSIPTEGAVALVDASYKKHKHAFVIFRKGSGAEETFLAENDAEMNDWLGRFNYTAAFETSGVRPRGLMGGNYDGQRQRGIRRLESSASSKSTETVQTPTGDVVIQRGKIDRQLAHQIMVARRENLQVKITENEEKISQAIRTLDSHLRDARHLQIMAPIQPKTRENVMHAAGRTAAKLKWIRIEIWRMKCHRDILAKDLEDEKVNAAATAAKIQEVTAPAEPTPPHKAHRNSALARLNSKASLILGGQKSPQSPTYSMRPGTKSSQNTDFGEDAFKTPPEGSRQSSPANPQNGWELPPLSIHSSNGRRASTSSLPSVSARQPPLDRRASVASIKEQSATSLPRPETPSRYSTPTEQLEQPLTPQTPKDQTPVTDGRPETPSESDIDPTLAPGSPDSRSKARRSLHRTLRDSQGSHHRRSKHGNTSMSSTATEDTDNQGLQGLPRASGKITVHGKKASVITFGSEWQNMSAEERLKTRRPTYDSESRLSVPLVTDEELSHEPQRSASIASESTATARSIRSSRGGPPSSKGPATDDDDNFPSITSQRQVSSSTVRPFKVAPEIQDDDQDSADKDGLKEPIEEEPTEGSDDPDAAKTRLPHAATT
ncbi:hypothetical protein M501DRAFT_225194 [Patellaria atrata CBS 101060]|uniref:SEC7 domain-containing protein n=1 Tax=Patellaria atrata CBS 101060 TaxID=1346257 RepID=A0A9P4S5V9_9PEZI|nr:hypothetical protein M501DRAFT_225194 [Patellaria atrata CBS 101060]